MPNLTDHLPVIAAALETAIEHEDTGTYAYDGHAEVAKYAAALLAVREAMKQTAAPGQVWEPLEDGIYHTDGPEVIYLKDGLLNILGEHYVYLKQGYALCRRAQPQAAPSVPRPDWSIAPSWAIWWAMDCNGLGSWYEAKPTWDEAEGEWHLPTSYFVEVDDSLDGRTTLQQRPAPGQEAK